MAWQCMFISYRIWEKRFTTRASLTEFHGITEKLLQLELCVEIRKTRQEPKLMRNTEEKSRTCRRTVPGFSWPGQGRHSQTLK